MQVTEQTYRTFNPVILKTARRFLRGSDEIEDVVQSTWVDILRTQNGPADGKSQAWFATVTKNRVFTYFRVNGRRRRYLESLGEKEIDIPSKEPTPEQAVISRELTAGAMRLIARRNPLDARIAKLRFFDGMSMGEIAAVVHVPENTVKVKLWRLRGLGQRAL